MTQRKSPPKFLKPVIFLVGIIVLVAVSQVQWMGYVLIAGYVIVALVRRLPARMTAIMSLMTLAMVPLAILTGNWLAAQNFAAYTFVLFVFALVGTTYDLKRQIAKGSRNNNVTDEPV